MAITSTTTEQSKTLGRTTSAADTSAGASGGDVERSHSQAAQDRLTEGERRAAAISAAGGPDPFPPYDLMTLPELRATAEELGVSIPEDVEKSLLITELRAYRSGGLSVARKRSA